MISGAIKAGWSDQNALGCTSVDWPGGASQPRQTTATNRKSPMRFAEFLYENNLLSEEQLIDALADHWSNGGRIGSAICRRGFPFCTSRSSAGPTFFTTSRSSSSKPIPHLLRGPRRLITKSRGQTADMRPLGAHRQGSGPVGQVDCMARWSEMRVAPATRGLPPSRCDRGGPPGASMPSSKRERESALRDEASYRPRGGAGHLPPLQRIARSIPSGLTVDGALDSLIARANAELLDRDEWGLQSSRSAGDSEDRGAITGGNGPREHIGRRVVRRALRRAIRTATYLVVRPSCELAWPISKKLWLRHKGG